MTDRFSNVPKETLNLLDISYIKSLCENIGIFEVTDINSSITFKLKEMDNEFVRTVLTTDRKYKGKILFGAGKTPYFTLKLITLDKTKEVKEFIVALINALKEVEAK